MSKRSFLTANGVVKIVAVRFFAWGALSFLEDEVQLGGTTKLNLDDEWLAAISKSAAKVHARKYQEAVEEIEDFLIGKRLNSLYELRQVQAAAKLLYQMKGQFRIAELEDDLSKTMNPFGSEVAILPMI